VDVRDRALHQVRHEVRIAAVDVRQMGDREGLRHTRSVGGGGGRISPRHPDSLIPCCHVTLETPHFQAYRGEEPPRFVNEAELEYAKILDYHGVPWLYEPHTFVLERDAEGKVIEAFTPDFYLPEQDLYLEVTVMKQSLVTRKNRKLRKLRELYPEVRVK